MARIVIITMMIIIIIIIIITAACSGWMDGWMVRIYADHHFNITTIIINSSYNPSFNFNLRACVLLFMRTNNIQYVRYGCRTLIVVWEK